MSGWRKRQIADKVENDMRKETHRFLNHGFIVGFAWFCVFQPLLFVFGVVVFLSGVFQSIWG